MLRPRRSTPRIISSGARTLSKNRRRPRDARAPLTPVSVGGRVVHDTPKWREAGSKNSLPEFASKANGLSGCHFAELPLTMIYRMASLESLNLVLAYLRLSMFVSVSPRVERTCASEMNETDTRRRTAPNRAAFSDILPIKIIKCRNSHCFCCRLAPAPLLIFGDDLLLCSPDRLMHSLGRNIAINAV